MKQGLNLALLKNEDIGKWVMYEDKKNKVKEKGRLVSWNTVMAFVVFNVKGGDKFINKKTTACAPIYLSFCNAPGTPVKEKKVDE